MGRYDEASIVAEAEEILGDGDAVLAAGYFGLPELLAAQIAGGTAGALTGSVLDAGAVGLPAGAGLGGLAAKKSYAESRGVTIQMIVAVTAGDIHVLNRGTDGRLPSRVASFDRSRCRVDIARHGLNRIITFTDPDSGGTFEVHGVTSALSALAKGDKAVLDLLAS